MMSPLSWLVNPPQVQVPVGAGRVVLMFSGRPVTPERAAQVVLAREERAEAAREKREAAVAAARRQREALLEKARLRREQRVERGKLVRRKNPGAKARIMAVLINHPDLDYEQIAAFSGLQRQTVLPSLTVLTAAEYLDCDDAYSPRRYRTTAKGVRAFAGVADALA